LEVQRPPGSTRAVRPPSLWGSQGHYAAHWPCPGPWGMPHAVDPAAVWFFPVTAPSRASVLPSRAGSLDTVGCSAAKGNPAAVAYSLLPKTPNPMDL